MKESDYINAENLTRVRIAQDVIRGMVLDEWVIKELEWQKVIQQLYKWSDALFKLVGTKGGE